MNYQNKTFSVGPTSKEAQKNYESNWDKVFGKKDRDAMTQARVDAASETSKRELESKNGGK